MRVEKKVTDKGDNSIETTQYFYHGKKLMQQVKGNHVLHFYYDVEGRPAMVMYNGTMYTFAHSLQGDIAAIVDNPGNLVVEYKYDAWGNITTSFGSLNSTLGKLNPFRYRGYVYDVETGLHYVFSRYYDPEISRFINADGQIAGVGGDIRGNNLFAYCFNTPVNMIDPTGNWPSWGQVFAAVATVAVAAVFVAAVAASVGAVGVAVGVGAASIGATGAMVSAAITVGTVGTYAVAAGIGACALSNAGEILTGTNVICDGLMGGNQEAYDTVQTALNIAGGGAMIIGQANPGVTGNAAKPNPNAQTVHKVPPKGTANTSFDKLYSGKNGDFQRTYYDFRGNMSLQIDFTTHSQPSEHSNPHLHTFWFGQRRPQTNLWYLK